MPSGTFRAHADTWVDEALPSTVHGHKTRLFLSGTGGARRRGYVYFAKPFNPKAGINVANLHLWLDTGWSTGGPHSITIRPVAGRWFGGAVGVGGLTWDESIKVGVAGSSYSFSVGNSAPGTEIVLDLSDLFQRVSNGLAWYGLRIDVDTAGNKSIYSNNAEFEERQPALDLDWGREPTSPFDLSPSGLQVVALASPTLNWRYSDANGESAQSAYHVWLGTGIDAVGNVTGVLWDSGWVSSSETQTPVGIALTNGSTYFWQVAVKDDTAARRTSGRSDAASFVRQTKGGLVISSPPSGHDTSPPVGWTFTPGAGGFAQDLVSVVLLEAIKEESSNLLSADDAGFEASLGTWAAVANAAIAQDTAQAAHGAHSMKMTGAGAGDMTARTASGRSGYRVVPGETYSFQAKFLANTTTRNVALEVLWYGTDGTQLSASIGANVAETAGRWRRVTETFVAPNKAVFVAVRAAVRATVLNEVHWVDDVAVEREDAPSNGWPPGQTQTTFREIWRRARFATSSTTITLPSTDAAGNKLIRRFGWTYKVIVRVWDTADRTKTPGDTPFVEASSTFTYRGDQTQPGVDDVVAIANADGSVTVQWHRTATPDWFVLLVDDEVVFDRLVPSDWLAPDLGVGWYQKTFWRARLNAPHSIEVRAAVSSGGTVHHSHDNDVETVTPTTEGIWLIFEDTDGAVVVRSTTEIETMLIGESSTVYDVAGSRVPIKVTQGIRGYEGHVSGELVAFGGLTALRYHDRLETWAGHPNRVYTLLSADLVARVKIGNVILAGRGPTKARGPNRYRVEYDFWQVGRFAFDVSQAP